MLRTLLCAMLALFLVTNVGLAAGKKGKKGKGTVGSVVKFSAETGDLTIATGKKGKGPMKEFKLDTTISFVVFEGEVSKTITGKDGFKELKSGDKVKLTVDQAGKVTQVQIGGLNKKK